MGFVGTEEISNFRIRVCEFEVRFTTFYVQSAFFFA